MMYCGYYQFHYYDKNTILLKGNEMYYRIKNELNKVLGAAYCVNVNYITDDWYSEP